MPTRRSQRRRSHALTRLIRAAADGTYGEFLAARRDYEIILKRYSSDEVMINEILSTEEIAGIFEAVSVQQRYIGTPLVVCEQHAIGHGGFHTGVLGFGLPKVRWIYDCGSWRTAGKSALSKAVSNYASKVKRCARKVGEPSSSPIVELLFISHFDKDHVSGIDDLLKKLTLDTVVIPYLEPAEQIAIVLSAAITETNFVELFELVFDPGSWFGARGVRRVIRVRSGLPGEGDGTLPDGGAPPAGGEPSPELGVGTSGSSFVFALDDKHESIGERNTRAASGGTTPAIVGEMKPGGSFEVRLRKSTPADWVFIPHVSPASDDARKRVKLNVESLIGREIEDAGFKNALLVYVTNSKNRKILKKVYSEAGLGDANEVSLSLYSGPVPEFALRRRTIGSWSHGEGGFAGWLLTGDAALGNKTRRESWLKAFRRYRPGVGNLMIPHHGAKTNFHKDILEVIDENGRIYVTANAGDPSRPHEDVRAELGKREIKIVSENAEDAIRQVSGPNILPRISTEMLTFVENWT